MIGRAPARVLRGIVAAAIITVSAPSAASAQDSMAGMSMPMDDAGWHFMHDAALFGVVNHQGGPRGGDEFVAPNWWMGMLSRRFGRSRLTFNTMLSLDPATIGKNGYREIFQVGETLHGEPLVDRQHPHDFFMQLAGVWRVPLGDRTGITFAGGPAGEPAIGPVAFMHRASAAEDPFAPLSHHTSDSTHIAFGVATVAIDHGPWVVEGSVFNGREPDEHRWDLDLGRLDSVSGRVWFAPTGAWEFQVSTAHLTEPEALEPGDVQRTTASGSWFKAGDNGAADFSAVTVGYGVNAVGGRRRSAFFGEATTHAGRNSIFGRAELVQVETNLLLADAAPVAVAPVAARSAVGAFTLGGVRDVVVWRGVEAGLGAAVELYAVPTALQATHGAHPVSFQIFFRLRPPPGRMGRMWNMRMSQPTRGQEMPMDHMNMD